MDSVLLQTYDPSTEDYDDPQEEVIVKVEGGDQGLRVILGGDESSNPDILIERRPGGWAIAIHPVGEEGDPSGFVYIRDDAVTYVQREKGPLQLQMWLDGDEVPGINTATEKCGECGERYELAGDGYVGMCPGCADKKYGGD